MPSATPQSIRRTLPRLAAVTLLTLLILIVPVNLLIMQKDLHESHLKSSAHIFDQFEHLVTHNELDIQTEKADFEERAILTAQTVAFFIDNSPSLLHSMGKTEALAKSLGIDEIHYFSPEGELFFGTDQKHYGLTFDSGEQLGFFKPMLEDRTLKLVQPVMPNTAEGKPMQYAAVWLKSGLAIVQIGLEPKRLLRLLEEKSLAHVVSKLPVDINANLHAADLSTGVILASTKKGLVGRTLESIVTRPVENHAAPHYHTFTPDGRFCVYTRIVGDKLFIKTFNSNVPVLAMLKSSVLLTVYIFVIACVILGLLSWYLDRKICLNLTGIVEDMRSLEQGRLSTLKRTTGVSEMDELVFYFNQLLRSVKSSWDKLTFIADRSRVPVGFLDINRFYHRSHFNSRLPAMLGIDRGGMDEEAVAEACRVRLEEIVERPVDAVEKIFSFERGDRTIYLRIETDRDDQSDLWFVTDVTSWWSEIQTLRTRSNVDELTGLTNRRGMNEELARLFRKPAELGCSAMVLIDADGLKEINDRYGHAAGDRYLKTIADILRSLAGPRGVASRLGGDEFTLFLHGYKTNEELNTAIAMLRSRRGAPWTPAPGAEPSTLEYSLGIAVHPIDGDDHHMLLAMADAGMYRDKMKRKEALQTEAHHETHAKA